MGLFGEQDPVKFFCRGKPYRVERENGGFALTMELPFVSKGEVDLQRNRDELTVQVGPWRRSVILPRTLAEVPARDAKLQEGVLRVYFENPASIGRRR
jgi:arsenite-transporting ATPase